MFGELCRTGHRQEANYHERFVHERGYRSAIFNLGVLGGINLAQPIGLTPISQIES
jgi:hypothetical protein